MGRGHERARGPKINTTRCTILSQRLRIPFTNLASAGTAELVTIHPSIHPRTSTGIIIRLSVHTYILPSIHQSINQSIDPVSRGTGKKKANLIHPSIHPCPHSSTRVKYNKAPPLIIAHTRAQNAHFWDLALFAASFL